MKHCYDGPVKDWGKLIGDGKFLLTNVGKVVEYVTVKCDREKQDLYSMGKGLEFSKLFNV